MTNSLVSTGWEHQLEILVITIDKKMQVYSKYINHYLLIIFIFSVIFLIEKHDVGNDSTISEWIINYQGGFTKRGIVGQMSIIFSDLLNISLRKSILVLQIITLGIYYIFIKKILTNIELNRIIIFSIFSPVFILYPVAEVEVLARKEYFIFIFYLIYLSTNIDKYKDLYRLLILPISVLIWEPVIFFFPFWFLVDLLNNKKEISLKFFLVSIIKYVPALLVGLYIATHPISDINHMKMVIFLKEQFNERCYMSCDLLLHKSSIKDQFDAVFSHLSFEVIIRYFAILLIGFLPLLILISYINTKRSTKILATTFVSAPIIVLFLMMTDWGRVVNMFYTFSILTFLFLYKNRIITLNNRITKNFFFLILQQKKYFIFLFILFAFSWNPKTSMTGDIATNPLWKIPYNASKRLFGFDSFRILQDSPISIWHKKFIE
jgi:hypothetical protein